MEAEINMDHIEKIHSDLNCTSRPKREMKYCVHDTKEFNKNNAITNMSRMQTNETI